MSIFTSRNLFVLSLAAMGTLTSLADTFTVDGLQYQTITDNTVKVKKYYEGENVVIPSTVTDSDTQTTYTVVSVASYAFRNAAPSTITVAGTVENIEANAFARCQATSITLNEGVKEVGYGAFSNCSKLQTVTLPNSIETLGGFYDLIGFDGSAFAFCPLLKEINIPGGVKTIPMLTFQECTSLSKVTIGEGVTTIDERAFEKCSSLKSISFPSTLTTMNRGAFMSTGLETVKVPGTLKTIPSSAFLWCHSLKDFEIEEGVEVIGGQSFADCGAYTTVTVPNSVTHINTDAFQGNAGIKTFHIGTGIVAIGHSALAAWAPDEATNTPHWDLTDIYIDAVTPPDYDYEEEHITELNPDLFFGEASFPTALRQMFFDTVRLHVPEASTEAYRQHSIWGQFTYINGAAGIDSIVTDTADSTVDIYSITGVKVGTATESTLDTRSLDSGIYIIRSADKARKIIVR